MNSENEIVIPLEEAAEYARIRAIMITIVYILIYLMVWVGVPAMINYLINYFKDIVTEFSITFEYVKIIISPIIDVLTLFDYPVLFIIGLLAGIFLHELLHGIPAAIFAKSGFKSVRFGVYWKYLTPYTHFKEALPLKKYKIVLLTPGILLGIIPGIAGIVIQNFDMMMFGVVFTIGALGDYMVYERVKRMNNNILVKDHPKGMGLVLLE